MPAPEVIFVFIVLTMALVWVIKYLNKDEPKGSGKEDLFSNQK